MMHGCSSSQRMHGAPRPLLVAVGRTPVASLLLTEGLYCSLICSKMGVLIDCNNILFLFVGREGGRDIGAKKRCVIKVK